MQLLSRTLLSVVFFAQSTSKVTGSAAAGGQELYYISDGQSLTEVRSDPEHFQAVRWAAFYFKKGASSSVTTLRWGVEIQTSPAEVMKSVVASQKFERTYEKWCGCEWGSNTFFNVIAPVAITESSSALIGGKAEVIIKAQGIGGRLAQIVKTVNDASDLAAEKELPMRPTGPFAEYVENIHKALDQYGTINNLISLLSDNAVASIQRRLNRLADEVSNIETASQAVNQPTSTANSSGSFSGAVSVSAPKMQPHPNSFTGSPHVPLQPSSSTKAKEDDPRKVYTIQVGVFTSESKAEAMMSQLKKRQYDAVFIDAIPSGTGPFHVRVGRLPDMQAARDLRKRLAGDGFDTFITTLSQ